MNKDKELAEFAIEKLEGIKREIETLDKWGETYHRYNLALGDCVEIIDEHISELKGSEQMAFALLDHTEEKTTIDELLTGTFREKDRQINFAIEELEKIWDKIRALPDINPDYSMDKTIHISRYEVQKIIYERLAELKGEQE